MKPLIINIRGNSGSGKTYLTRQFMKKCNRQATHNSDNLMYFENSPWVVLGRYTNVCGGCDTIKTQQEIVDRVKFYTDRKYNVWLEGLILSTIYGTVGEFSEQFGNRWLFAYLDTPLDVCLKRVKARRIAAGNTKPLNEFNTRNRDATILRNYQIVESHQRRTIVLPHQDALKPLLKIIRKEAR